MAATFHPEMSAQPKGADRFIDDFSRCAGRPDLEPGG